ncbi:M3 family metallopeptidase [Microvirga lotononidis]|uniref:Zn-dependent oligopeptidase n=1 Tax=Microvirga lotononidis TaxID=864069 RepID=I4YT13_9HYPH|nr:M3 family metallopeptidase [Microvirga lotononidis]EIM27105.1 Zn-dependent oligopeptidase [Microvirga lotononidis]WQO28707.1 M3 family metallopeptidase [Microvirga lotononidis]
MTVSDAALAGNPLLTPWKTPVGLPPFEDIAPEHYKPAFDAALAEQQKQIAVIAENAEEPSFANTIEALEKSGQALKKVGGVFFNLAGSHTNDAIQAVEREMAPILAKHRNSIFMNEALFRRVAALYERRAGLGLTPEQARVLDRYHTIFVRAGAQLAPEAKKRLAAITERLASLGTQFSQNVLADEKSYQLVLDGEADLEGLPSFLREAAAQAAEERGLPGKHVITLSRSSIEPFLQFSKRRDLREQAFKAWAARGDNGNATDNKVIIAETAALRAERARLLGYETFADFKLADTMAKTPDNVQKLLSDVWTPAIARAREERDDLQAQAQSIGDNIVIEPWDWRYYADQVRMARHNLDEATIKPYFRLDRIIEASFETANRLFGLTFKELKDFPRYHPDIRAWEVVDADSNPVGTFIGDYFARPSKRSGAWMSAFRSQERLTGDVRPIIVNVMNFAKGAAGEPSLLSFDDARTLFHEFGHGLHGLLSNVTYPLLAGTAVSTDFVELPSQLYEHWLSQPDILRRYATHYRTGEPIPEELLARLMAARNFNQGFATVEYLSSAFVDLELHRQRDLSALDVSAFEARTLDKLGMPREIIMRHRTPHFTHVFSGDGYSSGYYSYLWSEVLDADAFTAFEETGDAFDRDMADKLKRFIYSAGNLRDPAEAYTAFRGRLPTADALLAKRGLAPVVEDA